MKAIIRLSLAFLVTSLAFSMDVRFQADSLRGSLGDIIQFGWQASHGEGDSLYFHMGELEGSGIELLSQSFQSKAGKTELRFGAAVYDSVGVYHFPDLVLYHRSASGLDSLFLRGPDLDIYSILSPADTSFRDIKGLHRIPRSLPWMILIWILLGGLLVYGLFRFWRMRTRRAVELAEQIVIIPPEEAHSIALRDLERLRREKYLRLQQFKVFHSRLTQILKQYLERRYLIDALELTTSELMEVLVALSELSDEQRRRIQSVLDLADLIKFAKAETNELESGESLNQVVDLVNHTKIKNDMGDDT